MHWWQHSLDMMQEQEGLKSRTQPEYAAVKYKRIQKQVFERCLS